LEYIGSAWPRSKPVCALQELVGVYGWKAICRTLGWAAEPPPPAHTATHEQDVELCRRSFAELVSLARSKGARVAVVQFLKKSELRGVPQVGHGVIHGWAADAGVEVYTTAEAFKGEVDQTGERDPFLKGDDAHLSPRGQGLLENVFEEVVKRAMEEPRK
jgi:hypothetical protein